MFSSCSGERVPEGEHFKQAEKHQITNRKEHKLRTIRHQNINFISLLTIHVKHPGRLSLIVSCQIKKFLWLQLNQDRCERRFVQAANHICPSNQIFRKSNLVWRQSGIRFLCPDMTKRSTLVGVITSCVHILWLWFSWQCEGQKVHFETRFGLPHVSEGFTSNCGLDLICKYVVWKCLDESSVSEISWEIVWLESWSTNFSFRVKKEAF